MQWPDAGDETLALQTTGYRYMGCALMALPSTPGRLLLVVVALSWPFSAPSNPPALPTRRWRGHASPRWPRGVATGTVTASGRR